MLNYLDTVDPLIDAALAEDVGSGDATTLATVPAAARAEAVITAKESGVLCGLDVARRVFLRVDPGLSVERDATDGDTVQPGTVVMRIHGRARGILTAERTALNFLQHLSGIATAASRAQAELKDSGVRVLDTRKTLPGMRLLAKHAVRVGGGANHRAGLHDMILIKENHIASAGGLTVAVQRARAAYPQLRVEVEVTHQGELEEALQVGVDRIMLDNYTPEAVRDAVAHVRAHAQQGGTLPELEASGGVTVEQLGKLAIPGLDFVSMGSLTHSVRAMDLSLTLHLQGKDARP